MEVPSVTRTDTMPASTLLKSNSEATTLLGSPVRTQPHEDLEEQVHQQNENSKLLQKEAQQCDSPEKSQTQPLETKASSITAESIIGPLAGASSDEKVQFLDHEIRRLQDLKRILSGGSDSSFEPKSNEDKASDAENKAGDWEEDEHWISQVKAIPKIRYVDWFDFKNTKYCDCTKFRNWAQESKLNPDPYAIEVLDASPKYYWEKQSETWVRKFTSTTTTAGASTSVHSDNSVVGCASCPAEMPDRIRINSKPILSFLGELDSSVTANRSIVLLRPYKMLIHNKESIKEHLNNLRRMYPKSLRAGAKTVEPVGQIEKHGDYKPPITTQDRDIRKGVASGSGITDTVAALEDFECLQEFIDKHVLPVEKVYRSNTCQKIRFQDLWHLYRPGDLVVGTVTAAREGDTQHSNKMGNSSEDEKWPVWKVLAVTGGRPFLSRDEEEGIGRAPPEDSKLSRFEIRVYRIDFDGSKFTTAWNTVTYRSFPEDRDISSLQFVPLRLHKDEETIRKDLTETGNNFLQYLSPKYRNYEGRTVLQYHNGTLYDTTPVDRVEYIIGPVMIDFKEAQRENPAWTLADILDSELEPSSREFEEDYELKVWRDDDRKKRNCTETERILDDKKYDVANTTEFMERDKFLREWKEELADNLENPNFTGDDILLLPKYVLAFVLQRREFHRLRLDCLEEIKTKESAWDDLKLRKGHKELLLAQLESHFRGKSSNNGASGTGIDIIEGKGLGKTFLLHGAPGVGKTSTAECIAAKLKRPLYPITCGDIGTDAVTVHNNLREVFSKAQKWDCVLLLDEADVFLAEREKKDIERNAIVSGKSSLFLFFSNIHQSWFTRVKLYSLNVLFFLTLYNSVS